MPRDIHVFIEKKVGNRWEPVLPQVKNIGFNHVDKEQNMISDSMYLTEFRPDYIYEDYNPAVWELFGVEGKFSQHLRGLPDDCCKEIFDYYLSFGNEAFDSHWISCREFVHAVVNSGKDLRSATELVEKICALGCPSEMRLILWFSQ